MKRFIPALCLVLFSCSEAANNAKEKVDETSNNAKEKVEDTAVCKGLIRDTMASRVTSVVEGAIDGDAPISVSDLKSIATAYALTLDSTSLLVGNLVGIAQVQQSLDSCDTETACIDQVTGEMIGSAALTCDGDTEVLSFVDGCQMYATSIDGGIRMDGTDWTFDAFEFAGDRFLDGGLQVVNLDPENLDVRSADAFGFEMVRNRDRSCEELMRFRTLSVERNAGLLASVDFDRETDSETDYSVNAQGLNWPAALDCRCPTSGAMTIAMQAFQGNDVPVTLDVLFQSDGEGCGTPTVTIPEATAFCDDYGCDASLLSDGLSAVFTGMCD